MLPDTTDFTETCTNKRAFRLPPPSSWELRSSVFYAAGSANFLPTFRDNLSAPFTRFSRLSRNVGKRLSLLAA